MSERKTEKIVRDLLLQNNYFEKDSIIKVEEQTSDFTNIKKLLQGASKSGKKGKGYPEFIITSKAFPQFFATMTTDFQKLLKDGGCSEIHR